MKKISLLLLGLFFVFSGTSSAAVFSDTNEVDTEYFDSIMWMYENGVIAGYPDETFRPDDCVKRAEFLKMLFKTLEVPKDAFDATLFSDTFDGQWYTPYVKTARAKGTIDGYPDGTFRPDQCVNRVEAIKMGVNEFYDGIVPQDAYAGSSILLGSFKDLDVNAWYYKYFSFVILANAIGQNHVYAITNPQSDYFGVDQYFDPDGDMSRKEAAEMLYRLKTIRDNDLIQYNNTLAPDEIAGMEDDDDPVNEDVFCTMEYDPVCGVDGNTYANMCIATQQYGVSVLYYGECSNEDAFSDTTDNTSDPTDTTANTCENSIPLSVCGVDKITYENSCEAQKVTSVDYLGQCTTDINYTISSKTLDSGYLGEYETDYIDAGYFKYYLDKDLFDSNTVREAYIKKILKVDKIAYDFLVDKLGFTPYCDEIVTRTLVTSQGGYAAASNCLISNYPTSKYTQDNVNSLTRGNTHELVHIFMDETNVERSWFEEGLADLMEHYQGKGVKNNSIMQAGGWTCGESGWEMYPENVAYSDFSRPAEPSATFYSPLNSSSFYRSAECFWDYIFANYGENGIRQITQAWNQIRTAPHDEDDFNNKWLFEDIITPLLGGTLYELAQDRYNYTEGLSYYYSDYTWSYRLGFGNTFYFRDNGGLKLTFTDVISDTRCPINHDTAQFIFSDCTQSGSTTVEIRAEKNGTLLDTYQVESGNSFSVDGFEIEFSFAIPDLNENLRVSDLEDEDYIIFLNVE